MNFAQAEEVDNIDSFFKELKNFNYANARQISQTIKDRELQNQMTQLADILFFAGQREVVISESLSNEPLTIAIENLKKGYYHLYSKSYTGDSFEHFQKFYQFSREVNNLELEKFAVLSILENYRNGVEQANDDMFKYLERFVELKNDDADEYHHLINVLQSNLRNIFKKITIDQTFFKRFVVLMERFNENHPFWANYLSSRGVYLETLDEYDLAEINHKKAIESIHNQPFLKYIKFRSFIRLSEIYRVRKKSEVALKYVDSAANYLDLSDTTKYSYYINLYKSKNFDQLNQNKEAFDVLKEAYRLKVLVDYDSNNKEISRLNARYQTAEKEKQILEEQQKVRTNRNWLIAASLALIFGAGIAILLQKNTTKKRLLAEQETLLKQERVDNLLKAQELLSIDAMIEGQEKERQKVANELHDDLGSLMATIKLHFDNAKSTKKDPALQSAQKLLDDAYQKIRGMAHSKNSGVMSDQGLLPAIKKMAAVITHSNALEVKVEDFGMGERLENSLELNLFRMIQELVANTIKHAQATKVTIQLTQHEDNLNIIVEDNGKGFDRYQLKATQTGMGLTNIEKRVEHLEGSFTVDSVLGKGTSILIDLPV